MDFGRVLVVLAIGTILVCPVAAWGESAEQAFANGKTLLAKGDFQGALKAYATAARADRANRDYLQQYTLVRRIVMLRDRLGTEKGPKRWEYVARALHSFYVSQDLYSEALAIDKKIHARLNNASSARMLAETQLAMRLNEEAAKMLAALDPNKATPATQALLGVALARQNKLDQARQIATRLELPENVGPRMTYCAARLHAIAGNPEQAIRLLARVFEGVPPSQIDGFKEHARLCPDFARLASTADFAKALTTKSKVPESACSGGRGCANCPKRGNCPHSRGQ